jgi:fumarate reductase subunit C
MKTYTRPMRGGWWTRNPFYRWYMVRELSSVFITLYALVLLWGLAAAARGPVAYDAWLARLAGPAALGFHGLTLALVTYHAWTWFKVMPKTLPRLALADRFIVAGGVSAALTVSALLLWIA